MRDHGARDLLREWEKVMHSIPRPLLEPMQRQLELVQEIVERERRLQAELTGRVLGPVDAVFDLLEDSAAMLHRQAETLEAAGRALAETATLMQAQAELFERTIHTARRPAELAKAAAGVKRQPRKRAGRQAGSGRS
jgi:hypothetical protein